MSSFFRVGIVVMLFFIAISVVEGAQGSCGDGTCQRDLEDDLSCPQDCINAIEEGILEGQEGYVTLDSGITLDEGFTSDPELSETTDSNEQDNDVPFTSSLTFKIILILIVLIVVGLVGFLIYDKMKENNEVSESNEVPSENPIQLN